MFCRIRSRIKPAIPSIKASAVISPRSTCFSHGLPFRCKRRGFYHIGQDRNQVDTLIRRQKLFSFSSEQIPWTPAFPVWRHGLAEVPSPFRSASSGISSAPAVSIAASREIFCVVLGRAGFAFPDRGGSLFKSLSFFQLRQGGTYFHRRPPAVFVSGWHGKPVQCLSIPHAESFFPLAVNVWPSDSKTAQHRPQSGGAGR